MASSRRPGTLPPVRTPPRLAAVRRVQLPTCELVEEAVSARLDGEASPLPRATVARHLAACPSCRRFEEGCVALQGGLDAARAAAGTEVAGGQQAAPALGEPAPTAASPLCRADGVVVLPRRPPVAHLRRRLAAAGCWMAAVAPLGFAVPALALGAFGHVHVVPTHLATPCTALFHHPGLLDLLHRGSP